MNSKIREQIKDMAMEVEHLGGRLILYQGKGKVFEARSIKEIGAMMRREEAHVREIHRMQRARLAK